jgi:FlaA1/EpsC-like NDP-sugar epimerase
VNLISCLLDINDIVAVNKIMREHQPQIIFHAAAYKHVPMLEFQVRVAMYNNVLGTYRLAKAAVDNGVDTFIFISTDKAVNPANVMGASKRAAEVICQNYNGNSNTRFITVRFGNVLGSAGSVVPLFQSQLAKGEDLTVTHPEVSRYFMTIPEACQLILQAAVMGKGGEIFVLDMGEPIKISFLAEQLIHLSGKRLDEDVNIIYTGLRPGEKLHEELFHEAEELIATEHEKILQAQYRPWNWTELMKVVTEIAHVCNMADDVKLQDLLLKLVPEYKSNELS